MSTVFGHHQISPKLCFLYSDHFLSAKNSKPISGLILILKQFTVSELFPFIFEEEGKPLFYPLC